MFNENPASLLPPVHSGLLSHKYEITPEREYLPDGIANSVISERYDISAMVTGNDSRERQRIAARRHPELSTFNSGYFLYDSFDESGDLPYLLIESDKPIEQVDKNSRVVGVVYTDFIKPWREFIAPPGIGSSHNLMAP